VSAGYAVSRAEALGRQEIVVLEGVFEDDWGAYCQGTWMQATHLAEPERLGAPDAARPSRPSVGPHPHTRHRLSPGRSPQAARW
jgi:hypothetical protein